MFPNCRIDMSYNDPLLAPKQIDYSNYIDAELNRLEQQKQQLLIAKDSFQSPVKNQAIQQATNQTNLWSEIDREIASLTPEQQKILASDEIYSSIDTQLQLLIQNELINSVKDKVANSEQGKALLEKQLANIKDKKAQIVEESNKELELFKKFQIAVQANPNLTYVEFIKAINNEK